MQAYMLNKLDTTDVKVVLRIGVQYRLTENAAGRDAWMSIQLRTAPDEGQELVVIQPPNSM